MPRERALSGQDGREPHALSLKVLRLSRPTCVEQFPVPELSSTGTQEMQHLSKLAHSYPSASEDDTFILTPLLALPPSFGSAYVGEQFTCCLCANNSSTTEQSGVKISAQMQTPSMTVDLPLSDDGITVTSPPSTATTTTDNNPENPFEDSTTTTTTAATRTLAPKETIQKIVKHDLKEEGPHVLSVLLSYNAPSPNDTECYRVRTFRKMYQFHVSQCLTVRTKTSEAPLYTAPPPSTTAPTTKDNGGDDETGPEEQQRQYKSVLVLEAQLENMGENPITLETINLNPRKGWIARSLNWDKVAHAPEFNSDEGAGGLKLEYSPLMKTKDIMQVAFYIEPDPQATEVVGEASAQLKIEWRSSCGDRGFLSTGYLAARKKG